MLLNRAVDKLIEEPKAEQGDVVDFVHVPPAERRGSAGRSIEATFEGFTEPNSDVAALLGGSTKTDLGPLDAQLDARGCKADVDQRHGKGMCTVAGGSPTW